MIIINIFKDLLIALIFFFRKRVTIYAAASSFYFILSLIPMCLLMLKMSSFFLPNISESKSHLWGLVEKLFPAFGKNIISQLDSLLTNLLFSNSGMTAFNSIVLFFVSMAFLNSLWQGLSLITGDKYYISWKRYFKGLLVIAFGILLLTISQILPALILLILGFLKNNLLMELVRNNFELVSIFDAIFSWIDGKATLILRSNFINGAIFLLYFTFLYRWFFSHKGKYRISFLGALIFMTSILIGKNIFWYYLQNVRANALITYGDFYLVVATLLWIFLIMCFFFFGACVCYIFNQNRLLDRKISFWS